MALHYLWFCLLALYSLYIGQNNAENNWEFLPISERYNRLPQGLYRILTVDHGLSLVLIFLALNTILLWNKFPETWKKIKNLVFILITASVIYTVALPLGGYRSYRSFIIRNDTFMPVLLSLYFLLIVSCYYLLKNLSGKLFYGYIGVFMMIMAYFTISDKIYDRNSCERNNLIKIANSNEDTIQLHSTDCSVFSWGIISNPEESKLQSKLLYHWHVTDKERLYYQK